MPARTRLAKQIRQVGVIFALIFLGLLIAKAIAPADEPSYKLSNDNSAASQEIATNAKLIGKQIAEVDMFDLNGQMISTASYVGAPTIFNIWYSTCEPCRRELPVLAETAKQFDGQVQFVGINIKDTKEVAKEFADRYGVEFATLLDANGKFISALEIGTAPVTLAVDAQGKIVDQVAGEISADRLNALVSALLK